MAQLRPMDDAFVLTVAIVSSKVRQVLVKWQQAGRALESLGRAQNLLLCFRSMEKRIAAGDKRATEYEVKTMNELSGWLITTWHELRGTPVPKTDWTDGVVTR